MSRMSGFGYHHVTIALMLLISVYFAAQLSKTAVQNARLEARQRSAEATVQSLKAANQSLKDDLSYYNSDQYVEYAARNELGLMKPGDHVLRVIANDQAGTPQAVAAAPAATPVAAPKPTATPAPAVPNWQKWRQLFFQPGT